MIVHSLLNKLIIASGEVAGHAQEAAGQGGGHGEGGVSTHLPSLLDFIPGVLHFVEKYLGHGGVVTVFGALIAAIMIVVFVGLTKKEMIPGPLQNAVEMLFGMLYDLVHSMLGKNTDRYIPFLATLFIYIWFMNLSGIVPLFHAPTSSLNMTAALAISVFLFVQYTAIRRLGPLKYLYHLAGEPTSGVTWALVVINFPLHFFGEFIKPFSLAVRLFGNIFGEDTLIAVMVSLGVMVLAFIGSPVGLPFQIPFYFLSLLLGTIQALVFTLLSTSYILMVLPHEEHAH